MVEPSLHPRIGDLDLPARGLLGLLDKSANDDEALSLRRKIDSASNTIASSHAHFPEFAFKVIDMRPPDLLRAEVFKHLGNTQEVGIHIGWKALQLWFSLVGNVYVPAHEILYLF
jgi:hypothetical protein